MSTQGATLEHTQLTAGDEEPILTHYAKKSDITRAMVEGTPITALCGKVWIPSRDPEKYPLCPACKRALGKLKGRRD